MLPSRPLPPPGDWFSRIAGGTSSVMRTQSTWPRNPASMSSQGWTGIWTSSPICSVVWRSELDRMFAKLKDVPQKVRASCVRFFRPNGASASSFTKKRCRFVFRSKMRSWVPSSSSSADSSRMPSFDPRYPAVSCSPSTGSTWRMTCWSWKNGAVAKSRFRSGATAPMIRKKTS